MTIYCVLCKKEPIPGDKSCNFHKFPDDEDLKQKWMAFIGITCVSKYTKLCSDHFDDSAYAVSDGYASKRYLLKNATPKSVCEFENNIISARTGQTQLNLKTKQTANADGLNRTVHLLSSNKNEIPVNICNSNQQECDELLNNQLLDSPVAADLDTSNNYLKSYSVNSSRNDTATNLKRCWPLSDISDVSPSKRLRLPNVHKSATTKPVFREPEATTIHTNLKRNLVAATCSYNLDVSPSKKFCSSNSIDSSPPIKNVLNTSGTNISHANMKRNASPIDVSDIPPTKRFCFFDGSQPMYMLRKDFSSDESWTRFLKYTIYKKRQSDSSRKKNERNKKKIGNITELISKLREENATAAADYLQELPEHVKQLISRMKNNKPTNPFPAHLKMFARSLHFHSPAAYDMVRKSFLKCLPCIETLNRWNCSKNYKPGISEEIINHVSEMVKN